VTPSRPLTAANYVVTFAGRVEVYESNELIREVEVFLTRAAGPALTASWGDGILQVDANGNGVFEPDEATFFGLTQGDQFFVGDFDGDGNDEAAVFGTRTRVDALGRPYLAGVWTLDLDGDHQFDPVRDAVFEFGLPGDFGLVGDWDGDGTDEVAVARAQGGEFVFVLDDGDGSFTPLDIVFTFGTTPGQPLAGDWDGDGADEVGLMLRAPLVQGVAANHIRFQVDRNGNRVLDPGEEFVFGEANDDVRIDDANGDGTDDISVARSNLRSGGTRVDEARAVYTFDLGKDGFTDDDFVLFLT
jgi:hypothetical protein